MGTSTHLQMVTTSSEVLVKNECFATVICLQNIHTNHCESVLGRGALNRLLNSNVAFVHIKKPYLWSQTAQFSEMRRLQTQKRFCTYDPNLQSSNIIKQF